MRFLVAGGGTGGHLFPGIALAQEMIARSAKNEVLFVGTAQGLEGRLVPREGFPLRLISASGFKGRGPRAKIRALLSLPKGVAQSIGILRAWRPDVAVGVGGYASGPVLLAATALRIPRAIIEPNAIPGITNRLLGHFVNEIYVAWDETAGRFPRGKAFATGNPIRRGMRPLAPVTAPEKFTVLVFGGSQGAHRINTAVIDALGLLGEASRRVRFMHQTGQADLEEVRAAYTARGIEAEVAPFFDNMEARYAAAELVVSRAGATTIAELAGAGMGAILIPFPFATDDHQAANARVLERAGAARVVLEKDLTPAGLAAMIRTLAENPALARAMGERAGAVAKPDAARVIVDRLKALSAKQ